ncbi:SLC13 family permease [Paenibacillus apis]|uniref:Sodium-dependent dicarboxylate transporter SdcS n=1 Tax=Paenibacillus apis TaxID=1792174 RepID=A0A919XZU6_9BACL|nr:SLC13 family permease [Paenibacillus apis]GIO41114.1 membrane protein [Paenibacillus apis]
MKNTNTKKIIGAVLGLLFAIVIAFLPPFEGLDQSSMIVLGTLAGAIIFWIIDVMPDFAVALIMCASWVVLKVVPFNVAFSQFSGTSWWMVIGGLGIGIAVSGSGLMKRIALHVMKFFPTTFRGQSLAVLLAGLIVSPTIPSTNAKGSIAAPLSLSISDTMGYERKSKPSAGLFLSMFFGFVCASPIFLSATFMNYVGRGLLDESVQKQLTWGNWFLYALPWSIVFLVGSYFAIQHFFKPEKDIKLPGDFLSSQLKELGTMSKNEKITAIVLVGTLALWMLEKTTGISSAIIAILAVSILVGLKVISVADFKNKIPWNAIIFIGCALNLGTVLPEVGIDQWIGSTLTPMIKPVLQNPYILVVVLALLVYAIRFLLVSLSAAVTIFILIVLPLLANTDISPFIIAFATITSVNIWILQYQNPPFLTTYYAIDGKMATAKQTMLGSVIYMVVNIVGLLVSVPIWQWLGLIG